MIIERRLQWRWRRRSYRVVTYRTTRPRALLHPFSDDVRAARAASFTASCVYECALMDGDLASAARIRQRTLTDWIRKVGAYEQSKIPRHKRKQKVTHER